MITIEDSFFIKKTSEWVLIKAEMAPGKFPRMWWYEIDVSISTDIDKLKEQIPTLFWEHSGHAFTLRGCWKKAYDAMWDVWEVVKEEQTKGEM